MLDEHDLIALLKAYVDGDVLARKVLADALDEAGDPRAAQVREEPINWKQLARELRTRLDYWNTEGYYRFLIDCVRVGASTQPEVVEVVRNARRTWVEKAFPGLL